MPLQCPHCQSTIVIEGEPPREVVCPSCGSSIQLDPGATGGWLPDEAPKRLGRFEFLEQLGVGSFGTVYKARDTELDRLVALKVPRSGSIPKAEDMDRFLREAKSAAQLKHPGIVALYDAGPIDGTCCLVSEFIPGATLAQHLSAKRFGSRQAAELIAEVADALHYAHQHGVVHRDIKPSNIMLDLEGRPHLMDFGLAKRAADEITLTLEGQVLGTPAYMSPEQAKGEVRRVDARNDLYGLGVILYELLTGELPFRGQTRMLLVQVMQDEPRPPRRLNDRIPRDLETICLKAMAKEPGRRYATARALADDLRRFLKGEPIQARPTGALERAWRWAKRRPAAAALLLVSGLAALAAVAGVVSLMDNFRLQEANEKIRQALLAEESERKKAEQAQYFNLIARAYADWQNANHERGQRLLQECPPGQRNWEWHYLNRLYDAALLTFPAPRDDGAVTFSPDGTRLASSGPDATVKVWDARTGKEIFTLSGHTPGKYNFRRGANGLAFSPDGKRLASAGGDMTVRVWNMETGASERTFTHEGRNPRRDLVMSVAFSPDGKRLASAGWDGNVYLWELATDRPPRHLPVNRQVNAWAFSPDGRHLIGAVNSGPSRLGEATSTVRVWDAATLDELHSLPTHGEGVTHSVAYRPDGRQFASAGWDGKVKLWDATAFAELHGTRLVSGGGGGTLKVWDARPLTEELRTERQAIGLLQFLFAKPLFKDEVIAAVRRSQVISESVREKALTLVERFRDEAHRLNIASWAIVRAPGATPGKYQEALRWAEIACRLAPEDGRVLNTLGVAQYRLGQFQAALGTLTKSEKLNTGPAGSNPGDLAFLAMAQHQLGSKDAQATLERFREEAKKPTWAANEEVRGFLQEAEALLGSKNR